GGCCTGPCGTSRCSYREIAASRPPLSRRSRTASDPWLRDIGRGTMRTPSRRSWAVRRFAPWALVAAGLAACSSADGTVAVGDAAASPPDAGPKPVVDIEDENAGERADQPLPGLTPV